MIIRNRLQFLIARLIVLMKFIASSTWQQHIHAGFPFDNENYNTVNQSVATVHCVMISII